MQKDPADAWTAYALCLVLSGGPQRIAPQTMRADPSADAGGRAFQIQTDAPEMPETAPGAGLRGGLL